MLTVKKKSQNTRCEFEHSDCVPKYEHCLEDGAKVCILEVKQFF